MMGQSLSLQSASGASSCRKFLFPHAFSFLPGKSKLQSDCLCRGLLQLIH